MLFDVPHKGEVAVIHIIDIFPPLQILNPLDWKYNVDIFIRVCMVIVIMGNGKIIRGCVRRNLPESGITGRIRHVKGCL